MKVERTRLRMLDMIGKPSTYESQFFTPATITKEKPLRKRISQQKSIFEHNLAEGD